MSPPCWKLCCSWQYCISARFITVSPILASRTRADFGSLFGQLWQRQYVRRCCFVGLSCPGCCNTTPLPLRSFSPFYYLAYVSDFLTYVDVSCDSNSVRNSDLKSGRFLFETTIFVPTRLRVPLVFQIWCVFSAHFHHLYHEIPDYGLSSALQEAVFRCGYTSLFGGLSSFLFVQNHHNLLAPIAAHVWCNYYGSLFMPTGRSKTEVGTYLLGFGLFILTTSVIFWFVKKNVDFRKKKCKQKTWRQIQNKYIFPQNSKFRLLSKF